MAAKARDMDPDARDAAAQTVRALRLGLPTAAAGIPDDGDLTRYGSWREGIRILADAAAEGQPAVERAYQMLCVDQAWLGLVAQVAPPTATAAREPAPAPLPPLVAQALTTITPAGTFIDRYLAHASAVVPRAPASFHEACALTLLAAAVAGRCIYQSGTFRIVPNMWTLLIAPPAAYTKSQTLDLMTEVAIASGLKQMLLLHQRITPEALVDELRPTVVRTNLSRTERDSELAARAWAPMRAWVVDEAHGLFASAKREFNADLMPALNRLYDSKSVSVRTKGRGTESVERPCVSFFGATTPGAIQWFLADRSFWRDGFLSRVDFVLPDGPPAPWSPEADASDIPSPITHTLRGIRDMFPAPENTWIEDPKTKEGSVQHTAAPPVTLRITPEGRALYDAYRALNEGTRLAANDLPEELVGSVVRLALKAIKVAMLLACADAADAGLEGREVVIEERHVARGVRYAERQRTQVLRVYSEHARTEESDLQRRILARLTRAAQTGDLVTAHDLCEALRAKAKDVTEALLLLSQAGTIGKVLVERRNRKVEAWVLLSSEPTTISA